MTSTPCRSFTALTIVDRLEAKGIGWEGDGSFQKFYAQKHNPFVYFNNVAINLRVLPRSSHLI